MKVYFNNSCKICRAEINMYKKQNIENLNWIDITKNKNAELETKKTDKELLRRLHVEKDGQIYVGIDGFLLIWKIFQNTTFFIYFLNSQLFTNYFMLDMKL